MRQDQISRLQDLAESVGEVFLEEADPNNWNGAGLPLSSLDSDTRGNRYWDKKNAIQTGSLLARILDLKDRDKGHGAPPTPEDDADKEIKRFEKQAKDLIGAIQRGAG
jgi:hypothetical protein